MRFARCIFRKGRQRFLALEVCQELQLRSESIRHGRMGKQAVTYRSAPVEAGRIVAPAHMGPKRPLDAAVANHPVHHRAIAHAILGKRHIPRAGGNQKPLVESTSKLLNIATALKLIPAEVAEKPANIIDAALDGPIGKHRRARFKRHSAPKRDLAFGISNAFSIHKQLLPCASLPQLRRSDRRKRVRRAKCRTAPFGQNPPAASTPRWARRP